MSERSAAGRADTCGVSSRGRVIGWFWILFWLVFLVEPVTSRVGGSAADRWGAAALVIGSVAYVLAMRHATTQMWGVRRPEDRAGWLVVVAAPLTIGACMAVAVRLVGPDGYSLLPYAAVVLAMGLPVRWGIATAMVYCVVVFAIAWAATGAPPESGLVFSAVSSAAASGLGAYSIGRNMAARRAERDAAELRLQEARNAMARDLHDILGHSLTVITMKAELAGRLVDVDPVKAKVQIDELEQLSRSALADVRRAVTGYREISLAGELARARAVLRDKGIRADLPGSVDDVAPDLRELFAWAVREATTNIVRHSGARTVTVTLGPHRLRIHDDGRGSTSGAGNGLTGLAERATAVGATLTTSGDDGFTVLVEDPTRGPR